MISPEEIAELCLGDEDVKKPDQKALCFKQAAVIVFDGLIIWRGDLNMAVAQNRLRLLARAVGLPVAVVQQGALEKIKRKKTNPGKFLGPMYWQKHSAWTSEKGLDPTFWVEYDKDCCKAKEKAPALTDNELGDDVYAQMGCYPYGGGGFPD